MSSPAGAQRYVFDLNTMEFIMPPGNVRVQTVKVTLIFDGFDVDAELEELEFLKQALNRMNFEAEDDWERLFLAETIRRLDLRKNILLNNVMIYLNEFWREIEFMERSARCPNCGKPYYIRVKQFEAAPQEDDKCTSAAG
ncbi:unnamed protein product [Leptosia nina]|uniref:Uncharacterized protein n=1 Tax=Leptosia nina TaxID=320188 RepID=A0AAV1K1J4_9NEOP